MLTYVHSHFTIIEEITDEFPHFLHHYKVYSYCRDIYSAANLIDLEKFADGTVKSKVFTDSDAGGTQILLNMLNMASPNSLYHHLIMLLSPGPDTEYNMRVYEKYLNKNMAR